MPYSDNEDVSTRRKDSYYSDGGDSYDNDDYSDESFYSDDSRRTRNNKSSTKTSTATVKISKESKLNKSYNVRRGNTKTIKKNAEKGRSSKNSKTGGGGGNTPRGNNAQDYVTRRMLSARRIKINELKNEMEEMAKELEELRTENKLMRRQKNIQEKQLERYEGKEGDMPQVLQRHQEEVRNLREQLKRAKDRAAKTERKLHETDDELTRTQQRLTKAKSIMADKNLGERDTLAKKLMDVERSNDDNERKVQALERHVENLQKNARHEVGIERARNREIQQKAIELQKVVDRLQGTVREKEKEIEVRNIYANRITKPPHRLSSTRSTPAPMQLSSRDRKRSEPLAIGSAEKSPNEDVRKESQNSSKSNTAIGSSPALKQRKENPRFPMKAIAQEPYQYDYIPEKQEEYVGHQQDLTPGHGRQRLAEETVAEAVGRATEQVTNEHEKPPEDVGYTPGFLDNSTSERTKRTEPNYPQTYQPSFGLSGQKERPPSPKVPDNVGKKSQEGRSSFFITESSEDVPSWLRSKENPNAPSLPVFESVKKKHTQVSSIEYKPSLGAPTKNKDDPRDVKESEKPGDISEQLRQQERDRERQQQDYNAKREVDERRRKAAEETEQQEAEERARREEDQRRMEEEQRRREREEEERRERERVERERREREEREREERERQQREEEAHRLANSQAEKERQRQKELLLAKMKAIDNGGIGTPSPNGSPSRQKRNYSFTKPIENLHSGKAAHIVSVPVIERRRKSLQSESDEDLAFGSYAPTLASTKRESFNRKDSGGLFGRRGSGSGLREEVDIKPKNATAAKKSNLLGELFGSQATNNTKAEPEDLFASPNKKTSNPRRESGIDNDPFGPRHGSGGLLPKRDRQANSATFNGKLAVNAVDDLDDDIEEVML